MTPLSAKRPVWKLGLVSAHSQSSLEHIAPFGCKHASVFDVFIGAIRQRKGNMAIGFQDESS